ncbi:MAG TPA: iron chelate uptake ABC transporter family permease subunit [Phycisphaerales bacterium]|nr:iron chelate uptake ABC transporter family permease subunit [Phycisphaerales bacterium]
MLGAKSLLSRLLTFSDFNTNVVLLGSVLLGMACGLVGTFTVLRGRSLMADALAHAALPGVCIAFLLTGSRELGPLLAGALAFGVLGVLAVMGIRRSSRVKEDAAIALVLSSTFGLGVALLSVVQRTPNAAHAGLEGFIFGKAASMVVRDVQLIAAVAAIIVVTCAIFYRQFKVLCFDRDFAHSAGLRVALLDFLLMGLVCVCTVVALPAVGLVLVVALLTIPAVAARCWSDRLGVMAIIAAGIGAMSGAVGTAISANAAKLSAGAVITLVAAAAFVVSLLAAPRRGVIARWIRERRLRRKIALQNVLRAVYEVQELQATRGPVAVCDVMLKRAWRPAELDSLLARAQRSGEIVREDDRVDLTSAGREHAMQIVRTHRLWELYLVTHASIASDHVDRDADTIEHVLPAEILQQLEARLREDGRLPGSLVPASPHAVAPASRAGVHG